MQLKVSCGRFLYQTFVVTLLQSFRKKIKDLQDIHVFRAGAIILGYVFLQPVLYFATKLRKNFQEKLLSVIAPLRISPLVKV